MVVVNDHSLVAIYMTAVIIYICNIPKRGVFMRISHSSRFSIAGPTNMWFIINNKMVWSRITIIRSLRVT